MSKISNMMLTLNSTFRDWGTGAWIIRSRRLRRNWSYNSSTSPRLVVWGSLPLASTKCEPAFNPILSSRAKSISRIFWHPNRPGQLQADPTPRCRLPIVGSNPRTKTFFRRSGTWPKKSVTNIKSSRSNSSKGPCSRTNWRCRLRDPTTARSICRTSAAVSRRSKFTSVRGISFRGYAPWTRRSIMRRLPPKWKTSAFSKTSSQLTTRKFSISCKLGCRFPRSLRKNRNHSIW